MTPTYDAYINDTTEGTLDAPDKDLEPTPEVGDNYVNTDFMLPRGSTLSRGRVIECKSDADGKPVGRSNDNPILYSRHYLVDFEDGEVTKLTANIIAESIYPMYDPEGEHVLFFIVSQTSNVTEMI